MYEFFNLITMFMSPEWDSRSLIEHVDLRLQICARVGTNSTSINYCPIPSCATRWSCATHWIDENTEQFNFDYNFLVELMITRFSNGELERGEEMGIPSCHNFISVCFTFCNLIQYGACVIIAHDQFNLSVIPISCYDQSKQPLLCCDKD